MQRDSTGNQNSIEVDINEKVQRHINYDMTEAAFKANHTRAIVVLHRGKLIAEAYNKFADINESTPLLGWSMTKRLLSF